MNILRKLDIYGIINVNNMKEEGDLLKKIVVYLLLLCMLFITGCGHNTSSSNKENIIEEYNSAIDTYTR